LFPDAVLKRERLCGWTKALIAVVKLRNHFGPNKTAPSRSRLGN
jgi:hypothetical protein